MLEALTLVHVLLSLAGIAAGIVVVLGMFSAKRLDGWTSFFLWTTIATSVTGYFFPVPKLLPSHIVGAISLIVLGVAYAARYKYRLAGTWRGTYAVTAVTALYLNVFVLVVQLFEKVPALRELAPTQSEPPFAITQLVVLLIFAAIGIAAPFKFRVATLGRA